MNIKQATRLLEEAIYSLGCDQPFRCRWHKRYDKEREPCPAKRYCPSYEYARALRKLVHDARLRRAP